MPCRAGGAMSTSRASGPVARRKRRAGSSAASHLAGPTVPGLAGLTVPGLADQPPRRPHITRPPPRLKGRALTEMNPARSHALSTQSSG